MSPAPKKTSKRTDAASSLIMDSVKLLLSDLTTPETNVRFDPPGRANPASIQNTIHPPDTTWTWADETARDNESVDQTDVGKYGLQTDVNTLFQLSRVSPQVVWKPIYNFTTSTWTWANETARRAERVTGNDVGKIGVQTNIDTYFKLTNASPAVWQPVPNPTRSAPFELSTGASDAESYHDFFRLQIAFEDVWVELLDTKLSHVAHHLYATWDALMDESASRYDNTGARDRLKRFAELPYNATTGRAVDPVTLQPLDLAGAEQLSAFLSNLKIVLGLPTEPAATSQHSAQILQLRDAVGRVLKGCNMLLAELNRVGTWNPAPGQSPLPGNWRDETAEHNNSTEVPNPLKEFPNTLRRQVFDSIASLLSFQNPPPGQSSSLQFPDLLKLLTELELMLRERYRFDVFAPASINYGLLLNYRQHWVPQSYQVGNLVSTIPLAPQETRKYTTKTVVKKTRQIKEINESLRSGKDDSSNTWRLDAEIVDRAKNQTNFQTNASGSYGNGNVYKVEAGLQHSKDQAVESAQTKRDFHEAVIKSAQEYRNEHRLEITTDESREDEATTYREIRNPNDELTVTYLFYELQRRYLVDESLHKATPVILVANDVPAPHEVDNAWILRHDWIIKRSILDDSFLPALDYLATNYTGEEVTLQTLELAVQHQKSVVDKISQQVLVANQSLDAATYGLVGAQGQSIAAMQQRDTQEFIKGFFDPLGIGKAGAPTDGNTDRARVEFAKEALNRAQAKASQLTSDLKSEMTALQMAIDKFTTAATRHFSMLAAIDRLRIHVKDNIIHYMQAIWSYEPPDQRYFRIYNLDVPVFKHNTTVELEPAVGLAAFDSERRAVSIAFPPPTLSPTMMKLHQVADVDNLLGFKGNYMIFPLVNFDNYMAWYLMQSYIHFDDAAGLIAADPDPYADMTVDQLKTALSRIYARDPASFNANVKEFEEVMLRLLSKQTPEMVIVPSNSLYIEALPGTHPLLEDFKLIHRAIDVKKAQAEARHAELENLRLAARLAKGKHGDPEIDKLVVVENGKNVTVDAGQ